MDWNADGSTYRIASVMIKIGANTLMNETTWHKHSCVITPSCAIARVAV